MPPKDAIIVPKSINRKYSSEKKVAQNLLNDFNPIGSRGEKLIEEITRHQIKDITRVGLVQIATVISFYIGKKLERNFTRRKELLIKWFNDNEDLIIPIKSYINIKFEDDE